MDGWKEPGEADRTDEVKNTVIPASYAYTALHLACSRVLLRRMPAHLREKLDGLVEGKVERAIMREIADRATGAIPSAAFLSEVISASMKHAEDSGESQKIVAMVREEFRKVRKEIDDYVRNRPKRERKVKDVHTRHFTEPKKRLTKWASK